MEAKHQEAQARSAVYELLSLAFLYPQEGRSAQLLGGVRSLGQAISDLGWTDVEGALDEVRRKLEVSDDEGLRTQYIEVFGHSVSADCAPYESEYGQAHVFQKSHTLADLSSFYQAFGVELNPELKDRLDHISVETEFMHLLALKEAHARTHGHSEEKVLLCRRAQEAFLTNHLANWVETFAQRLVRKAGGDGVLGALARLLQAYMGSELQRFRVDPTPPSSTEGPEAAEDDLECEAPAAPAETAQEVVTQ